MSIKLKRVYEKPSASDGIRVLADRLWPRGLSKSNAKVDEWPKALAPSDELRKWFGHAPERWRVVGLRCAPGTSTCRLFKE